MLGCWTPLEGAESSAHCCGFFSVASDKKTRGPAAPEPHAGGWNKMSAACKEKPVLQYSTFWNTSSSRRNELWCFCGQWRTMPSGFTVELCPRPTFSQAVAFKGSCGELRQTQVWSPWSSLTRFLCILIISLSRFKLLVKDRTDAKAEEHNLSLDSSLIWPGRSRDKVSDSPHALVSLENGADKLGCTVEWNSLFAGGRDNGAHSSTRPWKSEAGLMFFNQSEMTLLSAARALYTAWESNTFRTI